jgi:hypothetical protein
MPLAADCVYLTVRSVEVYNLGHLTASLLWIRYQLLILRVLTFAWKV